MCYSGFAQDLSAVPSIVCCFQASWCYLPSSPRCDGCRRVERSLPHAGKASPQSDIPVPAADITKVMETTDPQFGQPEHLGSVWHPSQCRWASLGYCHNLPIRILCLPGLGGHWHLLSALQSPEYLASCCPEFVSSLQIELPIVQKLCCHV